MSGFNHDKEHAGPGVIMTQDGLVRVIAGPGDAGPNIDKVSDETLAFSMGRCTRWGGKICDRRTFFSVAAHSLIVAGVSSFFTQAAGPEAQLLAWRAGLLHDASEGLLGMDVPYPVKMAFPGIDEIEDDLQARVALRWAGRVDGLSLCEALLGEGPFGAVVKEADRYLSGAEAIAFGLENENPDDRVWAKNWRPQPEIDQTVRSAIKFLAALPWHRQAEAFEDALRWEDSRGFPVFLRAPRGV